MLTRYFFLANLLVVVGRAQVHTNSSASFHDATSLQSAPTPTPHATPVALLAPPQKIPDSHINSIDGHATNIDQLPHLPLPEAPSLPSPLQPPLIPALALLAPTSVAAVSSQTSKVYIIPTEFLSQVPRDWPYTAFGVGRKAETATWGLTDGEGRTVALAKHEVRWVPRPLRGTKQVGGGEGRLEGWRRTFVVPEAETQG